MKKLETSDGFQNHYSFLSNMYECPCEYNGIIFPSSEHLYQWLKVPSEETWWKDKILNAPHGKVAKKLIKNDKCPIVKTDNWREFKLDIMSIALTSKFVKTDLEEKLIDTYPTILVEYNYWKDTFWGVCDGIGENNLGKLLMELRKYLMESRNA